MIDKVHISKYLIGGRLVEWDGEKSEVYSVIKNEKKSPTLLGSIPNLDENASISRYNLLMTSQVLTYLYVLQ